MTDLFFFAAVDGAEGVRVSQFAHAMVTLFKTTVARMATPVIAIAFQTVAVFGSQPKLENMLVKTFPQAVDIIMANVAPKRYDMMITTDVVCNEDDVVTSLAPSPLLSCSKAAAFALSNAAMCVGE